MRAVLVLLLALGLLPAAAADRTVVIGVVFYRTPLEDLTGAVPRNGSALALVEGLKAHGWIPGRNARIAWRSAIEHPGSLKGAVEDLVRLPVDVMVVAGNDLALESARQAPAIPVVMASSDFPVENRVVASYSRPGGNITGLTNWVGPSLDAKRIALLKQLAPGLSRLAVFVGMPLSDWSFAAQTRAAADSLGVTLLPIRVNRLDRIDAAFDSAIRERANGLFVTDYPFAFLPSSQVRINELAAKHRLPAIHSASNAADAGALLTYGPDIRANYRRAADMVDKILRGGKAGEVPIEDPAKLDFVINLGAARAIGVAVPPSLLVQADRVIP